MSMIRCSECGKEISDKAYVCPNCGLPLKQMDSYVAVRKKIPGRGFGISGMIMGILGVVYSPLMLIGLASLMFFTQNNSSYMIFEQNSAPGLSMIPAVAEISIFGILAVVFGFVSRHKGYKKGQSTAALIMGFITIAICIAVILICIFFGGK